MSELKLKAYTREQMKTVESVHKLIEGEMYGPGFDNVHLAVDSNLLEKAFKAGGMATIIDLAVEGQDIPVIIKSIQRDYLKNFPIHVDFYRVKDTQKVNVEIAVVLAGKSFAVTNLGGMLVKNLQVLKIECLPKDLVKEIVIDLAKLANIHDIIRVENLEVPAGILIKNGPRDPIVSVIASRKAKSAASTGPATTPAAEAKGAKATKAAPKAKK